MIELDPKLWQQSCEKNPARPWQQSGILHEEKHLPTPAPYYVRGLMATLTHLVTKHFSTSSCLQTNSMKRGDVILGEERGRVRISKEWVTRKKRDNQQQWLWYSTRFIMSLWPYICIQNNRISTLKWWWVITRRYHLSRMLMQTWVRWLGITKSKTSNFRRHVKNKLLFTGN